MGVSKEGKQYNPDWQAQQKTINKGSKQQKLSPFFS